MNRNVCLVAVCALTLVVAGAGRIEAQQSERPNFLLILIDDMGREWLSCYGSEMVETPNIDRLAAQGIRFKNCYATPLCTTTRSVLLSGRYQFRTGWTWHSDPAAYGGGGCLPPDRFGEGCPSGLSRARVSARSS